MQLVDFFPPIVFKAIKKFSKPAAGIETYESISEASKASGDYNDKEIAAIVLEKTKTFIKGLNSKLDNKIIVQDLLAIQSIINIRSLNEKDLEVVELGGACGAFFHRINYFFPQLISQWYVVETTAMAEAGKQNFGSSQLHFETDYDLAVSKLRNRSLCIAQGVVQYIASPETMLSKVLSSGFDFIYLSRLPLLPDDQQKIISTGKTYLIDHGPGKLVGGGFKNKLISVPITFLPYQKICEQIKNHNYGIRYHFVESEPYALNIAGHQPVRMWELGFLLQKQ